MKREKENGEEIKEKSKEQMKEKKVNELNSV